MILFLLIYVSIYGGVHVYAFMKLKRGLELGISANLLLALLMLLMVAAPVVELLVGVTRDAQFGLSLTIGAGGALVELLADSRTLLFPVTEAAVGDALDGLKAAVLLAGYRNGPRADRRAAVDAVMAIAAYAQAHAGRLEELSVEEGETVDKGQILGWISSTERATLLDAALATSQEELEYWQELYKPTPLVCPIKGTVIARNFEPGQTISANDSIVAIADDLIIVANLDETDIGKVKNEQAVEVLLEAYPDREFECIVEKIAYDAKISL